MSAFGTKRTFVCAAVMSAFGGKADIANFKIYGGGKSHVRLDFRSAASRRPGMTSNAANIVVVRGAIRLTRPRSP